MAKTKGGRVMNPTDADRKQARKREINRNKKERDLQRATPKDVNEIKRRLAGLIEEEEAAKATGRAISKDLHIRRKVLQDAMKIAVAKERETKMQAEFGPGGVQTAPHGHGVPQRSPQDSVYYHPTSNPTGAPPPGKPQRYKSDVELMDPAKADKMEAERAARVAAAASDAQPSMSAPDGILPPPSGPPPGILPPPSGPPPGPHVLPPPSGPPPGMLPPPAHPPSGMLPPPSGPPPGFMPPPGPPLGAPPLPHAKRPVEAVIAGESTAVRTVPAQQNPALMAMVPATVRSKRQKVKEATRLQAVPNVAANAGFGLAPQLAATAADDKGDAALASFMDEIANM